MIRALFVGNFLSSHSGTKGVSEKIFDHFKHENGLRMHLVSRQGNKLLRFLEILLFASKYEYDVLHIDVFSGRAFYIARATARIARIRGKRILMTLRGGRLVEYTDAKPQLVLRTLRMASVVTTPSHFLRSYFSKRGLPVTYLPNTIDLTRFPYAKIEIGVHSPRLLWVRAFADIYNPVLAIRVLKTVLQYFP